MKARSLLAPVLVLSLLLPLGVGAASMPIWMQSNADGFGDVSNVSVLSLAPFDNQLYAGTGNQNGAQIWRPGNSGWVSVMGDGFGDADNVGIDHLIQFGGHLYAGTWNEVDGGEVRRSSDGSSWSKVVSGGFGDSTNTEVFRFIEFKSQIYAATRNAGNGGELWRSASGDSGSWSQMVTGGFGDANNQALVSLVEFNGLLYAGTDNQSGAEAWRTSNGDAGSWSRVVSGGFGDADNLRITLEPFEDYLYAGTYNYWNSDDPGAELWRCQICDGTDWNQVSIANGFGDSENRAIRSLVVFEDELYAFTYNSTTGMEVWRSAGGTDWEQVGFSGFSDTNNRAPYWDNSVAVFNHRLFVGTWNPVTGGEVWEKGRFDDVISSHWAYSFIEAIAVAGLTAGYPDGTYGPDNPVTRAEISVFLKKGIHGSSYTPPSPDGSHPFSDISGHWAEAWMEELYDEGLTSGYPDNTYRPENRVSRAEMAVFLLKAMHGSGYTPPVPSGGSFTDVASHWAEAWIEQLKEEGITSGYPDGTFGPENQVTRAEMAVFLVNAFSLPLP